MKKFTIKTARNQLYNNYLSVIQPLLGITDMELLILAELCKVQDKVTDKTLLPAVLSTETRKEIRTRLNMSEAAFNNNISRLKKKDLISDVSGVDDKLMLKGMTDIMFSFKLTD